MTLSINSQNYTSHRVPYSLFYSQSTPAELCNTEFAVADRVEVYRQGHNHLCRIKDVHFCSAFDATLFTTTTNSSNGNERSILYLIHYEGWGPELDEWLPEAMLMPSGTTRPSLLKVGKKGKEPLRLWHDYASTSFFFFWSICSHLTNDTH